MVCRDVNEVLQGIRLIGYDNYFAFRELQVNYESNRGLLFGENLCVHMFLRAK